MTTDTSEKRLETLICEELTAPSVIADEVDRNSLKDRPAPFGVGWMMGDASDYDREYCVDLVQLTAFLEATQLEVAEALDLHADNNTRRRFLARLQGEISKRGTIEVLRGGINHGQHNIATMFGTPSASNPDGCGSVRAQSVHRDPSVALQQRQHSAGVRSVPIYQWVASCDV